MNNNKIYSCREISPGKVTGEVVFSRDELLFYHMDFAAGTVKEKGHCLDGVCIKNKILVFPRGKGSSVVQMDGLYKLDKFGNAPLAFIVLEPDTVLVSCAIIMDTPMVDRVSKDFYEDIKTGDVITLDTQNGSIVKML